MTSCIPDQPPVETPRADTPAKEDAAASPPPDQPVVAVGEVAAPPDPRRTLLVVDDQPAVGISIAYCLEVCGYRTFRAESGQAAIDLFSKEQIDGVLLDVQMPRMNGLETSVRLHELARASNRRIIVWFMSGIYYREMKADCAKAGGVAVFQKPFDWPQLLAELDQGLSAPPPLAQPSADSAPIVV